MSVRKTLGAALLLTALLPLGVRATLAPALACKVEVDTA